jgi:hypothetical protein
MSIVVKLNRFSWIFLAINLGEKSGPCVQGQIVERQDRHAQEHPRETADVGHQSSSSVREIMGPAQKISINKFLLVKKPQKLQKPQMFGVDTLLWAKLFVGIEF